MEDAVGGDTKSQQELLVGCGGCNETRPDSDSERTSDCSGKNQEPEKHSVMVQVRPKVRSIGVQTKCSEKKFCDRAVQCSSILAPPLDSVTTESDIGTASETDNDLETNSNYTVSCEENTDVEE